MGNTLIKRCGGCGGGGAGMFFARRPGNAPEIFLPSVPPAPVLTAGLNAFGAWVNIGTTVNDYYLSHIQGTLLSMPLSLVSHAIELSQGPVAGVTQLDALRRVTTIVDPAADATGQVDFFAVCRPLKVAAGTIIWARAYSNDAAVARTYEVLTAGWDTALPAFTQLAKQTVAGFAGWFPSSTTSLSVIAGVAPAFGAWTQLIAAAASDLLITEIRQGALLGSALSPFTGYQLGIGAAGAEVACNSIIGSHAQPNAEVWPPVWVKAGERVAIRASTAGATNRPVAIKAYTL